MSKKTKRPNNSEIPVCKRDFSTSGAMATDQFIMPATPTNKQKKNNAVMLQNNLLCTMI